LRNVLNLFLLAWDEELLTAYCGRFPLDPLFTFRVSASS
jgi:hypothetical protein